MYSDDIWNLVLTSKSNNSSKSNIIPSQGVIESLKERNARLVKLINDSKYKDELLLAIENDYVDKFYLAMKIRNIIIYFNDFLYVMYFIFFTI